MSWLDEVKWDANGLVPAIAQEVGSNDVLMMAFMNREALAKTVELGEAVYWSRSRGRLWRKGGGGGTGERARRAATCRRGRSFASTATTTSSSSRSSRPAPAPASRRSPATL